MAQKAIGPSFYDELVSHGGLVGAHFTWSPDGTIEFFEDTPTDVIDGVNAVYAAHDPTRGSLSQNTAVRGDLLAIAANAIAPLQDAVDLGVATENETSLLTQWKQYRVLVSRIDLTGQQPEWPQMPQS